MSPHAKECQVEVHKELKIDLICMFAWNHLIRHVLFCVFCLDYYFWFWGIILLWRWKYDFKVTLIQVVQILFQSTFENSILGSLQSIQVFFLAGVGWGEWSISIVRVFLHEIIVKNSLILSRTSTLEANIFVQRRETAFIN